MTILFVALYYLIGLIVIGWAIRKLCIATRQTHYNGEDIIAWLLGASIWPVFVIMYFRIVGIRIKIR